MAFRAGLKPDFGQGALLIRSCDEDFLFQGQLCRVYEDDRPQVGLKPDFGLTLLQKKEKMSKFRQVWFLMLLPRVAGVF